MLSSAKFSTIQSHLIIGHHLRAYLEMRVSFLIQSSLFIAFSIIGLLLGNFPGASLFIHLVSPIKSLLRSLVPLVVFSGLRILIDEHDLFEDFILLCSELIRSIFKRSSRGINILRL